MEKGKDTYILPEGWIKVKLEDISKQITDGSHNPPKAVDKGVPMLSARNIENNNITFDDVRFITEEDFENENYRTKIETGDVLLTIVAIGRTAIVSNNNNVFTLQRSVAAIKPLINSKFLMYCFQSPLFQKKLIENAKGTAQKGVYLKTLRSLEIPIAPS
jgi:type I restriction enzyme S subunit